MTNGLSFLHPPRENNNSIDIADLWTPSVTPFISNVTPKKQKKIAGILSERLFYGIKDECDLHPILENNWEGFFDKSEFDFLLVESCLFSFLDDWRYALTPDISDEFSKLINHAKSRNIPVILWFTLDVCYLDLFAKSIPYFDTIFVADENALEKIREIKGEATFLPAAIQPRHFNPLRTLNLATPDFSKILIEGGKSIENGSLLKDALQKFSDIQVTSFERTHIPPQNYFKNHHDDLQNVWFRGKVSYRLLPEILKHSYLIISSPESRTTKMERRWRAIENAACMCPSVFFGATEKALGDYLYCIDNKNDLNKFVRDVSRGSLTASTKNHANWRDIFSKHTFEKRLEKIFMTLGISPTQCSNDRFSVITPTMRPDRLDHALENYNKQTYKNKELVIVVNGDQGEYATVKNAISDYSDVKICYMPSDHYAATSLNYATKFCDGKFIFRFDDDDYYGAFYLEDIGLMLKAYDPDVIGKFASFVKIEGASEVYLRSTTYRERNLRAYTSENISNKYGRISGATFGVKKRLLESVPFPDSSLASADSAFLEKLRIEAPNTTILKTDCFNFTIGRQVNASNHTWKFNINKMRKRNPKAHKDLSEIPR